MKGQSMQDVKYCKTSILAIAAFIISLLFFLLVIGPIISIILALLALSKIKKSNGLLQGAGLARAAIFISLLFLGLSAYVTYQGYQAYQQTKPITQKLLNAFTENNYEKAAENFHPRMRKAFPKKKFTELAQQINTRLGKCNSLKWGNNIKYLFATSAALHIGYLCSYEHDKNVHLLINFNTKGEKYRIMGIWFNSLKLLDTK